MIDAADQRTIEFALSYPFHIPEKPYLLLPGGKVSAEPMPSSAYKDRAPVLAIGSNRSPRQLLRKFPNLADPLPVDHGSLADHDVVYSAHLTTYGSVPAALACQEGCDVRVSVTWLNEVQLAQMHETESRGKNYDFGKLRGASLSLDKGNVAEDVFVYMGRRGLLESDGEAIPLAAISAKGRTRPPALQREALKLARDRVAPGRELDQFILETINNDDLREERNALLGKTALPSQHPDFEIENI